MFENYWSRRCCTLAGSEMSTLVIETKINAEMSPFGLSLVRACFLDISYYGEWHPGVYSGPILQVRRR